MGLSKIKDLTLCYKLAEVVGISLQGLKKHDVYIDNGFFFDHVLRLESSYVNFCKVNERNIGRYQLLLELNTKLKDSSYFIPSSAFIFEHNGTTWFYEQIPIFDNQYTTLTVDELKQFWNNIEQLNIQANSINVGQQLIDSNTKFFKEIVYYDELALLLPNEFDSHVDRLNRLYVNYVDLEKVFELKRIDNNFRVTGLQSFLPCPEEYAKLVSVIWSSFDDTDDLLRSKLLLLNSDISVFIKHLRLDLDARYYITDIDKLLAHYKRIEELWHREQ